MVKVPPCSARSSKNEAHLQCKATRREHSFSTEDTCQFPRQWEMAKTDVPMFFVKAFVKNRRVPFFFSHSLEWYRGKWSERKKTLFKYDLFSCVQAV